MCLPPDLPPGHDNVALYILARKKNVNGWVVVVACHMPVWLWHNPYEFLD
jgi:hypothetical protein